MMWRAESATVLLTAVHSAQQLQSAHIDCWDQSSEVHFTELSKPS